MSNNMINNPKVSVIMPVYNCENYVAEAIDSVLSQDYPSVELIVVNDGSTDNSLKILESYFDKVLLVSKQNGGAAEARNCGIEVSTGELIAFLDADDIWLPGKLSRQVKYLLEHEDIDMVYSSWVGVENEELDSTICRIKSEMKKGRDQDAVARITADSGWIYHRLLLDSIVCTITVLMRKRLVTKLGGFDSELKLGEDYTYWLKASRQTKIDKLDFIGAIYRLHGKNTTSKPYSINSEYAVVEWAVKKWGLIGPDGSKTDIKDLQLRLAKLCFDFGYAHIWNGDSNKAYVSFMECATHRFFWPKNLVYIFISFIKKYVTRS